MTAEELMVKGIIYSFLENGVVLDHRDRLTNTVYLSLPENSFWYDKNKNSNAPIRIVNAEVYARRIKETLIELKLVPEDLKLKYKTYPGYWTKEMGEMNKEKYMKKNSINFFDFM